MIDATAYREVARIPVGLAPKRILLVPVPRGMGGPGDPGWDRAAARPAATDYYLKDGGLVSCRTASFRRLFEDGSLSAESAPAFYRRLGLLGIELDRFALPSADPAALERILGALHREGRILTAINAEGTLVSEDADLNQRQVAEDQRLIRAAHYLGAPLLGIGLGQTGAGREADATRGVERAIRALRQLLPLARELGVRLMIENGPGPAETSDQILRIVRGTDPLWVGVCFNFERWADPPALRAAIAALGPSVFHAHVSCSDFDRFGNESATDYAYLLPSLAKDGFGSALSIDYSPGKLPPAEGVANMRDLLVKLWIGKGSAPPVHSPGVAP